MEESSSPVSKRSSTRSVKGKASIVAANLNKISACGNTTDKTTYTDSCLHTPD